MFHRQTVLTIASCALIVIVGGENVAYGAFMDLTDGDATSANAKYKVDPGSATVGYTAADVGSQQGTVKVTDTWPDGDCTAHKVTFMQTELPTDGFGNSEGLRLQLELMITNQSGTKWTGFWIKTDDNSVPANLDPATGGQGSHVHAAHFHPNSATPPPGPPTVSGMTGFTTVDVPTNTQMAMVGGGIHDTGKTFNTMGFFIHERNLKKAGDTTVDPVIPPMAVIRTFDLILMPHCVPEPSSLLQMMLGGVGAVWGWRRISRLRS